MRHREIKKALNGIVDKNNNRKDDNNDRQTRNSKPKPVVDEHKQRIEQEDPSGIKSVVVKNRDKKENPNLKKKNYGCKKNGPPAEPTEEICDEQHNDREDCTDNEIKKYRQKPCGGGANRLTDIIKTEDDEMSEECKEEKEGSSKNPEKKCAAVQNEETEEENKAESIMNENNNNNNNEERKISKKRRRKMAKQVKRRKKLQAKYECICKIPHKLRKKVQEMEREKLMRDMRFQDRRRSVHELLAAYEERRSKKCGRMGGRQAYVKGAAVMFRTNKTYLKRKQHTTCCKPKPQPLMTVFPAIDWRKDPNIYCRATKASDNRELFNCEKRDFLEFMEDLDRQKPPMRFSFFC